MTIPEPDQFNLKPDQPESNRNPKPKVWGFVSYRISDWVFDLSTRTRPIHPMHTPNMNMSNRYCICLYVEF